MTEGGETTLQLATFNTFLWNTFLFTSAQTERGLLIPKNINEYYPNIDAIVFQEIFDDSLERLFDKEMEKLGFMFKSKRVGELNFLDFFNKKFYSGGVKIYCKYEILDSYTEVFTRGTKEDGLANKGFAYIKFMKNGIPVHFIGFHLQSGSTEKTIEVKKSQYLQVKNFIDKKFKSGEIPATEYLFIGGDTNTKITLKDLIAEVQVIIDSKLVSYDKTTKILTRSDMQNRGKGATPSKPPIIDHFFVSNIHKKPVSSTGYYKRLSVETPIIIPTINEKYVYIMELIKWIILLVLSFGYYNVYPEKKGYYTLSNHDLYVSEYKIK